MAAIALLRESKCEDKSSVEIIKFDDVRMSTHMAQRQTTNTLCEGTERTEHKDVLKIKLININILKTLILMFSKH